MIRRLLAGLIVVGLAVGIWALWPRAGSDPTPTTLPVAAETTTTTQATTSTTAAATTSTTEDSHVVTTVEEAEEILRDLWFGWFEGIYNQDETRIREVVGTQAMLDAAREQFGVMEFQSAPSTHHLVYSQSEILRADEGCLVIWTTTTVSNFMEASTTDVHVLRIVRGDWTLVSLWQERNDLWEGDCDAQLEPLSAG